MKLKAYKSKVNDGYIIIGEKLPHGIGLADPCFPAISVTKRWEVNHEVFIISESDEYFAHGYSAPNYILGLAYQSLGGREKVEGMMRQRIERWREMTQE